MIREMSILVVDDSSDMREVISLLVTTLNHVELAGVATDGDEAILLCKQRHIDVAIMDIQMPRLDGTTTTRIIKRNSPDTQIIAYSSDLSLEKTVRAAGADYFLPKPVSVSDIENTLELIQLDFAF